MGPSSRHHGAIMNPLTSILHTHWKLPAILEDPRQATRSLPARWTRRTPPRQPIVPPGREKLSNGLIAVALGISPCTVKSHPIPPCTPLRQALEGSGIWRIVEQESGYG